MRKIAVITFGLLFITAGLSFSQDDPHGSTNSIYCEQCHIGHNSLGDVLVNSSDSLVSTMCLSCHTPGGWVGMTKSMSASNKATPGTSGTSHAWDVKDTSTAYGALRPQSAALLEHISSDSTVTCGTCHDPHNNSVSPFLRLDNSSNALCLDCHRSRISTVDSVRTYTGTPRSHPVGVVLPSGATWHNPPLDVDGNPQPSDGNTTNDYTFRPGGEVLCTSCHGIHNSDSNSGTVD
jgi:predicted CXXCH cytochrome family protein